MQPSSGPESPKQRRRRRLGHAVLFLVIGAGNGVGTVVVKIGLAGTNPLVFALLRNAFAALLTAPVALALERQAPSPSPQPSWRWAGCGVLLFGTNAFYTIGLKLASAVVGAAWQCTVPVLTSAYTILLGREAFSWRKAAGFVVASGGAAAILLLGGHAGDASDAGDAAGDATGDTNALLGNLCFLVNTNCLALYGIATRPLVEAHAGRTLTLTCGTFAVCAAVLAAAQALVASAPALGALHALLCPACVTSGTDWEVPASAVFGLCYMIVVFSFLAYGTINWANGFIETSKINVYVALQPMFAAAAVAVLVGAGFNESHQEAPLAMPSAAAAAGGICILAGLGLVLAEDLLPKPGAYAGGSERAATAGTAAWEEEKRGLLGPAASINNTNGGEEEVGAVHC